MKKRLLLYSIIIIFAGLISFFAVSLYLTHTNNVEFAKDTVMETAQMYASLYSDNADILSFVKTGNDTRITIIAPDGSVLADSRPLNITTLENHLNRPEIQAAKNGAPAAFTRYSDTLRVNLMYYALKVNSSDSYIFIRAAVPVAKIDAYFFKSLPLLLFLLIVVALTCFILVRKMLNRIIKPFETIERKLFSLSCGEYKPVDIAGSYEEINSITRNIDSLALILQNSLNELRGEKDKLDYILNNIGDGLFVVDENKNIVLINFAALNIFGANSDVAGKNINYLTFEKVLAGAVNDCICYEKNALLEYPRNGRIYLLAVKRLPSSNLTMIVFSDITESRENAKQREEFFANASHELKTPLTAIKGFNELIAINNKDENLGKYIDSIAHETNRMLTLIEDMLKLSELENMQRVNPIPVKLSEVAHEAREALASVIEEKQISFEVVGDAMVSAELGQIYELLKNLIENAARYNNKNGKVSVTIDDDKKSTRLTISDDGIGIPPEEQTRIFERFYRVEKSRSQRNGGTGLGLSIVKHICALNDWKLSLASKLGVGTEVTVEFKKNK